MTLLIYADLTIVRYDTIRYDTVDLRCGGTGLGDNRLLLAFAFHRRRASHRLANPLHRLGHTFDTQIKTKIDESINHSIKQRLRLGLG